MKKVVTLLLAALWCLSLTSALAAPRYPESQGAVTDAAAVLSPATVQDLRALAERLADADMLDLYVVTVDFLDGATLADYGAGLREKWTLEEDDLLLLMAVGEDRFGLFGGADVNRGLSAPVQQKLLSTRFETPFLQQDYDGAIAALMPALATEAAKAWDESLDTAGLFGMTNAATRVTADEDWLAGSMMRVAQASSRTPSVPNADDGFSLGKVILTVILLMVIFGNRKKHNNRGCGCGCMPFSSLLAGLGIWKLWKK